jgi:hypothetical protein
MDPLRHKYALSTLFDVTDQRDRMILQVADFVHAQEWLDAADAYYKFAERSPKFRRPARPTKDDAVAVVTQLIHWCLNNNRYWLAARLLWPENLFDPRPRFTRMIWKELTENPALMLMGAASCTKSYSTGVWLMLDWIRDPEYTCIRVLGPSEQHLNDNLFSHLVTLHREASVPLPGVIGDRFIGLSRRQRFGAISGVVVPLGQTRSGRIQGAKAGNRKRRHPHPVFGTLGRLRIFLDESEKIPPGIWKDIENVLSNVRGVETFKIICAYNPEDKNGPSGIRSEPLKGWDAFNPEEDEVWTSSRGWRVVRLDGEKCENVVEGVEIFPGLQTREGLEMLIANAGGEDSPGYWTMARACFPRTLGDMYLISQELIDSARGSFIFVEKPTPCAGIDTALEGTNAPVLMYGEYGYASGYRTHPTLEKPRGDIVDFRDADGNPVRRLALECTQRFQLPNSDTPTTTRNIIELCTKLGVPPKACCVDRTGIGQGVFDMLKVWWSPEVRGVNYTELPTDDMKILVEDTATPKDLYDRVHTELWFALRKWMMFNLVKFGPLLDLGKIAPQLTLRKYKPGRKDRVESKGEFKKHANHMSPDDADALTLLVHAVRKLSRETPSMLSSVGSNGERVLVDYNVGQTMRTGPTLGWADVTNRLDDIL